MFEIQKLPVEKLDLDNEIIKMTKNVARRRIQGQPSPPAERMPKSRLILCGFWINSRPKRLVWIVLKIKQAIKDGKSPHQRFWKINQEIKERDFFAVRILQELGQDNIRPLRPLAKDEPVCSLSHLQVQRDPFFVARHRQRRLG